MIDNRDRIDGVHDPEISISEGPVNGGVNVVQVAGVAMEAKLVNSGLDPGDAVLDRLSPLNGQGDRTKKDLDGVGADSIVDLADCHADQERVAGGRVNVVLDAVGPLVIGVEVASVHWVGRGSVSHVEGVVAVVWCIEEEDGPVVSREA